MNLEFGTPVATVDGPGASPSTTLSGRRLVIARAAWLLVAAVILGLFLVSIPVHYDSLINFAGSQLTPATLRVNLDAANVSIEFFAAYLLSTYTVSALLWSAVGIAIFWRRSEDWMALLTSLSLLAFGVFFFSDGLYSLTDQFPALWLPVRLLTFLGSVSFYLFFFLFPDGRFVPRWMYWAPLLWTAHEGTYYFLHDTVFNIAKSFPPLDSLASIGFLCIGVGAQIYRYRHVSGPAHRQQTKWVVLGMAVAGAGTGVFGLLIEGFPALARFASPYAFVAQTGILVFMSFVPLSIGVALLRYRLWDVDIVINRTLVYGILSISVVSIYALLVGSFGSLLQVRGSNFFVSLLAAGFVAVLFAPLRARLQQAANRLMYGERDDPYGVLSRLGRRLEATLEPDAVLPTIVETIAGALKLPYVAVAIGREEGAEIVAVHGSPVGEEVSFPLNYSGDTIGQLILAPRAPDETFNSAERRLLEDLARQAEVAVQAVRLSNDLQKSRERLVTAREEERRRLRRDLHDGLGPTLGSLTLSLDVSLRMLETNPEAAERMLKELKSQTKTAVSEIRRLVYGLRPPALDDLGLVPAISEVALRHGRLVDGSAGRAQGPGDTGGTLFSVEAPEELPPLPAAVEVACYRIAQEAITNVLRHARAGNCQVRLSLEDKALELEITDDGVGLPVDRRAGVGINSMAERSTELGGTCAVSANQGGGTRVVSRLPLYAEEE